MIVLLGVVMHKALPLSTIRDVPNSVQVPNFLPWVWLIVNLQVSTMDVFHSLLPFALFAGFHLAAVAHTQGEGVGPLEEGLELVARPRVVEDGLGPALAGAQDVAVGEAAAGGPAAKA